MADVSKPGNQPVILYVEDDPITARVVRGMLAGLGFQVDTADSVWTALRQVEARPPDVILLDWRLQNLTGADLIVKLAELDHVRAIPVVVLTSHDDAPTERLIRSSGVARILVKPATRERLQEAVGEALAKSSSGQASQRRP